MPSQGWFLDQLSDRAERFILNGQSFDPLKGDGIVTHGRSRECI
jgi:hypothetical protein